VAVGMMALLLTAVLALISLSVKNSRLAKDRTKAVGLAQEGIELMRAYRDKRGWIGLLAATGDNNLPKNWTVNDLLIGPCPGTNNIDGYYLRCVVLTMQPGGEVVVQVTVSWQEGGQTQKTIQTTKLSLWER